MQATKLAKISLSDTFIEKTKKEITPHWGRLGWVTYKRTYARWLPNKERTENWDETVKRVVEGNINLDPRLHQKNVDPYVITQLTKEAKQLFRLIYSLSATPSGRNLWISGTDYQAHHGDALNNCWFISIHPQPYGNSDIVPPYLTPQQDAVSMPFSFAFDQLMKGGGVGFSVTTNNIQKIPLVDNKVNLTVIINKESASYDESLEAGAIDKDSYLKSHSLNNSVYYKLPDSREGWVTANAHLIDLHFKQTNPNNKQNLVLDMSNIRPKGAKIRGFGGTASGPMPLIDMLLDINKLLNDHVNNHLTAVDCTDICNFIGKTVIAGNVRRSAELALGSANDHDFITMKQDQKQLADHRWASNNSVAVDTKFIDYKPVADSILHNGEPGIVNLDLSKNYGRGIDGYQKNIDPEVEGTNPCGEISLANGEPCNLFDVFPYVSKIQNYDIKEAFRLATRFSKRVTFSNYDWEISRKVIENNRRIGISMSGIQDWILNEFGNRVVLGYKKAIDPQTGETIKKPVFDKRVAKAVDSFYNLVVKTDKNYAKELHCNPSIKHTTVKPSGTVAKLAGVSEGMHFRYAGYMIQRIRFQDSDPLIPALRACGYHIEPDLYTKHTMVVEFPQRAPHADDKEFASAGTVSIGEQFATQAFLQTYWSDNAVSCTVTFQPKKEGDQIAPLMKQYRFITKSTSLLPYIGSGFKQMPKEPISQEKYNNYVQKIHDNVAQVFAEQNNNLDVKGAEIVDQSDCDNGACPIR